MGMIPSEEALSKLHPGLQRLIRDELGWKNLTDVQRKAIPVILERHDCIVEAPTAGGKTEAVLFPTLTRAAASTTPGVRVLYLAPLRALLNNLESRGEKAAEACGLRAFKWHGDVGQKEKVAALSDPPELLLTTPESLEAILLRRPNWQSLFAGLLAVILDEAHNFAAGDRGGHLVTLLERLEYGLSSRQPQRIALSATVGNPDDLLRWLAGGRRNPGQRVCVSEPPRKDRDFVVSYFNAAADDDAPAAGTSNYRRFDALCHLLRGQRSLVFARSRRQAESLAKAFARDNQARPPGLRLRVRTHHSAVSKYFREEAESLIQVASEEGLDAIVSTSTLELGIDIGELDRVIQMDALASSSSFLQRVGRTGRRHGRQQYFRGLTTNPDDLLVLTAAVNLGIEGRSEALWLPRRAFHLLAHQLICLALQSFGIDPARAWDILESSFCFSSIKRPEFDLLVEYMVEEDFLRLVDPTFRTCRMDFRLD